MCGITGIKPTYGRISRYGMIAFASSLDQAGPMGQSAHDCALLLNAMAGYDEKDSTCLDKEVPDYTAELDKPLAGLRIGLPKEYFGEGLDAEVEKVVRGALDEYKKLGAELIDIELPDVTGLELLSRFCALETKNQVARSKKIMVTAHGNVDYVVKAKDQCDAYLVKPIRKAALLEKESRITEPVHPNCRPKLRKNRCEEHHDRRCENDRHDA